MTRERERFYITTAISYPNGPPHIGHAYELVATDAIARWKRLDGSDVLFCTGTDEHGMKMLKTARDEGLEVSELADRNADAFRRMGEALGSSADRFIRTTEAAHREASQALWRAMEANGDIYKGSYSGWYSVRDEAYYGEDETEERDGRRFGPQGTEVEWVEEESYFFRLSAYADRLLDLYRSEPDFIGPKGRRNEVVAFVERGLNDLSISRTTFDWGVPVPGDERHVMYVWVDALTNYLTATGYPDEGELSSFWPADLHVIGKDIVRFHAIYWPAFLLSAGLALPQRVFGHGFLLANGQKMSKSAGNVTDPFDLVETYGSDAVRYFCLREVPFGQDGSLSHEAIVTRVNADLANDLGNLAQRSLSMVHKNLDGELAAPAGLNETDRAMFEHCAACEREARAAMEALAVHDAVAAIWRIVAEANRYFASEEPWALKKSDPERMRTVLHVTTDVVRRVAILAQPFVPDGAGEAARPDAGAGGRAGLRVDRRGARAGADREARGRVPPPRTAGRRVIVDSHCHLDFPDFAEERDAVVERARAAGIGRIVTICTRVRQFDRILEVARAYPDVFCSVGTHPHNAHEELDVTADELTELARDPKVVAIGEAGLDYHYDHAPRADQAKGLRVHIEAARRTGLPLVIHARSADEDMAAILREETEAGAFPAVLHCFSSGAALARAGVDLGLFVSFSGILTFKNSGELRDIAREVPVDRLLVETDAPYLAPVPHRGKRNEPAFTAHTLAVLAEVRGLSVERMGETTSANFFRLFSKVPRELATDAAA